MENLRRTTETQAFEEILGCLKLATREAVKTNNQIEKDRKEVVKSIDELLEMIEDIPESDL